MSDPDYQEAVRARASVDAELSVIIVNWNSRDFLRKCLVSLFANDWDPAWEVVVIDNASYDGCGEMLATEFPQVRFLQSAENVGFAAANIAAFSSCSGKHVLFLNPDTEVVGTAVRTLLTFLRTTPGAGAVGARLLNTDLTLQTSCIQRFPTVLNQALDSDVLRRAFPRASLWGMEPLFESDGAPSKVEAVSGACLMVAREAFEQIGGFTTRYFMYSEDVDLCYKLQAAGRRNYYLSGATVIHHGGKSTASQETGFSAVVMRESRRQFLCLRRGALYAAVYRLSTGLVAAVRLLLLVALFVSTLGRFRGAYLRGALLRWYKILRWSLGLEEWVGQLRHVSEPRAPGKGAVRTPEASPEATARSIVVPR
jgi:GT2 family glycosyltransferase